MMKKMISQHNLSAAYTLALLTAIIIYSCDLYNVDSASNCNENIVTWEFSLPDTGYFIDSSEFNNLPEFKGKKWEFFRQFRSISETDNVCREYTSTVEITSYTTDSIVFSETDYSSDKKTVSKLSLDSNTTFSYYYTGTMRPTLLHKNHKSISVGDDDLVILPLYQPTIPEYHSVYSKKYGLLYYEEGDPDKNVFGYYKFYKLLTFDGKTINTDSILSELSKKIIRANVINETMVLIGSGQYYPGQEGCFDGFPLNNKAIYYSSFYACKYEITNAQVAEVFNYSLKRNKIIIYDNNMYTNDSATLLLNLSNPDWGTQYGLELSGDSIKVKDDHENHPVSCITWYGAVVYCNLRSELEKLSLVYDLSTWTIIANNNGYRLPHEIEWEVVSRGKQYNTYPWGNTSPDSTKAFFNTPDEHSDTKIVGSYPLGNTSDGISDLAGNVWEWVNDWYLQYPEGTGIYDLNGPASGTHKVRKGGSFYDEEIHLRGSSRSYLLPAFAVSNTGFRVVRTYVY
jgi:formylglycine-generating enzyme required for sulfatase activity